MQVRPIRFETKNISAAHRIEDKGMAIVGTLDP